MKSNNHRASFFIYCLYIFFFNLLSNIPCLFSNAIFNEYIAAYYLGSHAR